MYAIRSYYDVYVEEFGADGTTYRTETGWAEAETHPETARRYVMEMDEEVQRLGDLVQELMMLSRLDSGRLEVGREQIDIVITSYSIHYTKLYEG